MQDLPHRGARQRGARPLKLGDDLLDPVPLTPQLDRPLAGGVLLRLALGTRTRSREQLREVRIAIGRDQRLHARLPVAEALGDLASRALLDEVGAQRLIATVRRSRRLDEALVSRACHFSVRLVNEPGGMVAEASDGKNRPDCARPGKTTRSALDDPHGPAKLHQAMPQEPSTDSAEGARPVVHAKPPNRAQPPTVRHSGIGGQTGRRQSRLTAPTRTLRRRPSRARRGRSVAMTRRSR